MARVNYSGKVISREEILSAIQDIAASYGEPPGKKSFENTTGIREHAWSGRYWTNWSDALREAGFEPNQFNRARLSDDDLICKLADLFLELGHFPTVAERKMKRSHDASFPSHNVFESRLGGQRKVVSRLVEYANSHPIYASIIEDCQELLNDSHSKTKERDLEGAGLIGYVYLIKMDRWCKIGATWNILRRRGEISMKLPADEELLHVIQTDDPFGVEKYWHSRFADKRRKGEWFELSRQDVAAFRKWKKLA